MTDRKTEIYAISAICDRALKMGIPGQKIDLMMDIENWHQQEPLDLDRLAEFDDSNFLHDIAGIYRHFDRVNKTRTGCFVPRSAA